MSAALTRVLLVEPDVGAAARIAALIEEDAGLALVGRAGDYERAWSLLPTTKPQVIIGSARGEDAGAALSFLRHLRYRDLPVESVMIVSSIDVTVGRRLRRLGVAQCLVAPVPSSRLRQALRAVAEQHLEGPSPALRQADVDRLWNIVPTQDGATAQTASRLGVLRELVTSGGEPLSAIRAARLLGVSRVTARRHLETLVTMGEVETDSIGNHAGRPTKIYQIKDVIAADAKKVS